MMRFSDENGFYQLEPFPGNSAICVSTAACIYLDRRGKGLGKLQHKQRLDCARDLGYTYIIATVNRDNKRELHILISNGWQQLATFVQPQTGQGNLVFGKEL